MKEFALVSQNNPDIGFGLRIKDDSQIEEAKRLAKIGYAAWSLATDPKYFEEEYGTEYFTAADVESFYGLGYQEPAEMLLDKAGIEYEFTECFNPDDEDEIIQDDVVWY